MDLLILSQWLTTGFMTGLIWFVQIVHYPIYVHVGSEKMREYQEFHVRRTTLVVFPAMVLELLGGSLLLVSDWQGSAQQPALWGFILLAIIWLSTLVLQIPNHGKIGQITPVTEESKVSERIAIQALVKTNWVRTLAWSTRLVLLAIYFPPAFATGTTGLQG